MKIIFAFRTRLSFLSKEKTLYTICYAVVNLLLALPRILTYGNSRVLPALFRFARDSGSLLAFLRPFLRFRLTSSISLWWAQMDSDHRPHAYQACALTN